jgi:hypothetical protein
MNCEFLSELSVVAQVDVVLKDNLKFYKIDKLAK